MEALSLVRVQTVDRAFLPYIPRQLHPLLEQPGTICVGAVYQRMACGATVAEQTRKGFYLRYLFVDPAARLCGLGTYLLRGLLGEVKAAGAGQLKAVYSASMLEDGRTGLGILERAGFSKPKPISTCFSTYLQDIPEVRVTCPEGMAVYRGVEVPAPLWRSYEALLAAEKLPPFVDIRQLNGPPWLEVSSFCAVRGELSGVLLMERRVDGAHIAGLYVQEAYRQGSTAAALIHTSLQAGRAMLPGETRVWGSSISRGGFSLCDKLLRRGEHAEKETEFFSTYRF